MKRIFILLIIVSFALSLFADRRVVQNRIVTSQEISEVTKSNRAGPSVTINAGSITISNGAELYINNGDLNVNTDDGLVAIETHTPSGSTNFAGPEEANDQLTINSSTIGSTTVTNHSGRKHPNGPNAIDRWWEINATTDVSCDITFRMRDGDVSGVTLANLRPFEYSGGSWTELTATYSSSSSSGGFTTVTFTGVDLTGAKSNNIITLNETGEDPLPVALSMFMATFEEGISQLAWTTQTEFNNSGRK